MSSNRPGSTLITIPLSPPPRDDRYGWHVAEPGLARGLGRPRPTPAELAAARNQKIPDIAVPGLRVLFCGINPSLYSAAVGHHFARPGNRFWPALHRSGFTQLELRPAEQDLLPGLGLGITNVVARATARASELSADELAEGGRLLRAKAGQLRPRWLAVVGVTAYRVAFGQPHAAVGPQDLTVGGTRLWVLPNPSGLNAHWTISQLAGAFRGLHERDQSTSTARI
jgi:TDG/mug DNA glycosylase family protein